MVEKFTVRPTEGESIPQYKKLANEHGRLKHGVRVVASLTIEENAQSVCLELKLKALHV
jgi:hypothetical protein